MSNTIFFTHNSTFKSSYNTVNIQQIIYDSMALHTLLPDVLRSETASQVKRIFAKVLFNMFWKILNFASGTGQIFLDVS